MRLRIDLDNILFRCLSATKDQPYYSQIRAVDFTIDRIIDKFGLEYETVLSGSNNFRKVIYPEYKANRKTLEKPRYLQDAREYCVKYWGAEVAEGMEADDWIAMRHSGSDIACVNDKDYKQIGGKLYNPWTDTLEEITNPEYWFWLQCLTGDKVDGIPGLKNPAKLSHKNPPNFTEGTASELLKDLSPSEMKEVVQQQYKIIFNDEWFERFDTACRLLFLRRSNAKEYYELYP